MNRRDFLLASASALAAGAALPAALRGQTRPAHALATQARIAEYFRSILAGFLRNARATGADFAVCDFPGGRKIRSCCTPSGKTYTSVARMLPALAEYVTSGQRVPGDGPDLRAVMRSIYRTAFDPAHVDYWGEPVGDKPTQRTVESSLVAIALARMGPDFVAGLSPRERTNVNRWLASCTVVPERTNNHAWFTAVNQATRLTLSRTFPEFTGDERWMIADLEAMDALAASGADGWYSDDPTLTVYDYYNFWTFGNFPLFWSRIAGDLYPAWNQRFRARSRAFLQHAPYFFASDGGVPLLGRSLLYRWAMLSPLLLGYEQGVWPHSPGLLRRIVRKNFDWWWRMGAYDDHLGKLRETLSPEGAIDVTENYMDNGHPYWAMQAFSIFSIPGTDPFWTAREEALPIETRDYAVKIAGPKMIVAGTKASGQVRWIQARNTPRRDYYRDKYNKFVSSSSFPFNVLQASKDAAPWDQALVLRSVATGVCASRIFPDGGELLDDGVRTTWSTRINGRSVTVISTIRLAGDFEYRTHAVTFQRRDATGAVPLDEGAIDAVEGSYPLGLAEGEDEEQRQGAGWMSIRSRRSGALLVSWTLTGHERLHTASHFDPARRTRVNVVHPRVSVISLSTRLEPGVSDVVRLTSLHYASPKPEGMTQIHERAKTLITRWTPDASI
ncbi:MAG TPA: DUF2264 domain-containing protein [Vicinamibacterales bacterium]|nr:DUF2264 domain-containing protein [Vicinamibacterales bacterium]